MKYSSLLLVLIWLFNSSANTVEKPIWYCHAHKERATSRGIEDMSYLYIVRASSKKEAEAWYRKNLNNKPGILREKSLAVFQVTKEKVAYLDDTF